MKSYFPLFWFPSNQIIMSRKVAKIGLFLQTRQEHPPINYHQLFERYWTEKEGNRFGGNLSKGFGQMLVGIIILILDGCASQSPKKVLSPKQKLLKPT
jgi:hypothetical protein